MKEIKINRFFQIIYPLLVYYIVYNVTFSVCSHYFSKDYGSLFCLLIAGIVTLIPEITIYKNTPKLIPNSRFSLKNEGVIFIYIILIVFLGITLNIIITQTGLINASNNFSEANQVLIDGTILIKICCNCIVIPILEELLYRGIIAGQIYFWTSKILVATVFSAFCFGFLHFNIVQFLYAFIVGLALSYVYIKCKRLWVVMLAHGLTNLIVILFS